MLLQGPARQGKVQRNRSKVSCKQHLLNMGRHDPPAPPSLHNIPPHGHLAFQRPRATGYCWHNHSDMQSVCANCAPQLHLPQAIKVVLLLDQGVRSTSHVFSLKQLHSSICLPSGPLCIVCQTSLMSSEDTSRSACCLLPSALSTVPSVLPAGPPFQGHQSLASFD